jgi:hypothetical protein
MRAAFAVLGNRLEGEIRLTLDRVRFEPAAR